MYCKRRYKSGDFEKYHRHVRLHKKRYYGRNSLYAKWFVTRRDYPRRISRITTSFAKLTTGERNGFYGIQVVSGGTRIKVSSALFGESRKRWEQSPSRKGDSSFNDVADERRYIDITFPTSVVECLQGSNSSTVTPAAAARPTDWHYVRQWRNFWDEQLKLPAKTTHEANKSETVAAKTINNEKNKNNMSDKDIMKPFVPLLEPMTYKCKYCAQVCKTEDDLLEHEGQHTGFTPYVCKICNARFAVVTNFRAHQKEHLDTSVKDCDKTQELDKDQSSEGSSNNNNGEIRASSTAQPPDSIIERVKRGPKPRHLEKEFKCNICGAVLGEPLALKEHMRTHTGEKPLTCKYCDMTFSHRGSRNKHQRRHEMRAGTYKETVQCNYCDMTLSNKNALKEHVSLAHAGDKPFKCRYCGKCFAYKCGVQVHERLHTGEKPYTCTQCPAAFIQLSQLSSHLRTHTGEKPYKCRYCGMQFRTCTVRKNHERIHTGEKPYHCSFCPAVFARRTNLKQHLISHTDVKPKQCQYCGKGLTSNRSLKRHEESHRRKLQKELEKQDTQENVTD